MSRAKAVVTDIIAVVAVLIPFLKKKSYCLWYRVPSSGAWVMKGGPFSHRQCEKTKAALVALGTYMADAFCILRKGVTP